MKMFKVAKKLLFFFPKDAKKLLKSFRNVAVFSSLV